MSASIARHAFLDHPGPIPFAHRGGADGPAGENTLSAFKIAVDTGYRYLETDVHATSDGVLLAFHDRRLQRVTDTKGRISMLTGAEVATARIGVATADLFPRVSLTGLAGLESISASDFFTSGSRYFTAGPTISWRIFEGGRLRANVAVQDARADQALHGYVKAVLTALEDVEDSLVAYGKERNRHDALVSAADENRRSVVLARDLYVHGLGTYLAVLDAERAQYASEDTLVQGDEALVLDLVATYKALGGGWAPPAEEVAAR